MFASQGIQMVKPIRFDLERLAGLEWNISKFLESDVLIFSNSIEEHFKHLKIFQKIVRDNGLVISATKIKLFQTNIRFLGFDIYQGQIKPIQRAIDFANKFPDFADFANI